MSTKTEKTNLLMELAKRKAEAQKAGQGLKAFAHFQSSSRPSHAQAPAHRIGRNGQGKP